MPSFPYRMVPLVGTKTGVGQKNRFNRPSFILPFEAKPKFVTFLFGKCNVFSVYIKVYRIKYIRVTSVTLFIKQNISFSV